MIFHLFTCILFLYLLSVDIYYIFLFFLIIFFVKKIIKSRIVLKLKYHEKLNNFSAEVKVGDIGNNNIK